MVAELPHFQQKTKYVNLVVYSAVILEEIIDLLPDLMISCVVEEALLLRHVQLYRFIVSGGEL